MKKFKFKFSPLIWTLLFVVLGLCLAGLGFNVFNLINYIPLGATKIVIYALMIALITFLIVLDVSIILFGYFTIDDKLLCAKFGLIKTKITNVVLQKKDGKLVVYASDEKYLVVVIAPELYDDFVLALRAKNKSIAYNVKENDGDPV